MLHNRQAPGRDIKTGPVTYPYPAKNITDLVPWLRLTTLAKKRRLGFELGVESQQGRTWIPRPAPLGLGRLACVRGGLIRIHERTARLMWPHWGPARPNLSRAQHPSRGLQQPLAATSTTRNKEQGTKSRFPRSEKSATRTNMDHPAPSPPLPCKLQSHSRFAGGPREAPRQRRPYVPEQGRPPGRCAERRARARARGGASRRTNTQTKRK